MAGTHKYRTSMYWTKEEKEWMKARGLADGALDRITAETSDLKSFTEIQGRELIGKSLKPAKVRHKGIKKMLKTAGPEEREALKERLVVTLVGDSEAEVKTTHGVTEEAAQAGPGIRYTKEDRQSKDRSVDYMRWIGVELIQFAGGSPILKAGRFEAVSWPEEKEKDRSYRHGPLQPAPRSAWQELITTKKYRKLSLDQLYAGVEDEPTWAIDKQSDPWDVLITEHEQRIAEIRKAFWLDALECLEATMKPQHWRILIGCMEGKTYAEVAQGERKATAESVRKVFKRLEKTLTGTRVSANMSALA